jgi:hypothetical protein
VISWSVKSDRNTFVICIAIFLTLDLRDKIAAIKCPTLILLQSSFDNSKPVIEAQYKNLKLLN